MKHPLWLALAALLFVSCQPQITPPAVTIMDGDNVLALQTAQTVPVNILSEAGISLQPGDRVLVNGRDISPIEPNCMACTLQVRRAVTVTLVTPDGQMQLNSAAWTVGAALREAGIQLQETDRLDPTSDTALVAGLTITYVPSRDLIVTVGGRAIPIRSSARTVGQALAEAGISLQGLDYSLPAESDPVPANGQIRIVRVQESVLLVQKPIPYQSEFIASAEVELDQQEVIQPGLYGLAVSRVRVRYEDGQEMSRATEAETLVRPAVNRITGYGTKIVIRTAQVGGATVKYWRTVQAFATSYSPCRSAADRCYYGTASGQPVQKGVVAVLRSWYAYMVGQPVFIPGYGFATVEDIGGGIPGKNWVDLAYSDDDWVQWGEWVTIYFLTPVPPNIMYILD
jgi:uncharacterized protein YabE (DUF348 family)